MKFPEIFLGMRITGSLFNKVGIVLFIILLAGTFSACAFKAMAKDRNQAQGLSAETIMKDLSSKLSLSLETKNKIRPIIYDSFEQRRTLVKEVREGGRGRRSDIRGKMQEYQKETERQLAEFLTSEQLSLYQEYISEQQEAIKNRRQRGGGRGFSLF